jgi:hypothetical protein
MSVATDPQHDQNGRSKPGDKTPRRPLARLLTIFGDLKVYRFPMFLLYDPGAYRVRGEDAREAMARVRPGDILLRGYVNYLDGYFIPGYFSHAGLYIGSVVEEERDRVERPRGKEIFRPGEQMVIHSMAEGVFMEDLLNFCRCDYMAILRFPDSFTRASGAKPLNIPKREWNDREEEIRDKLASGELIKFAETVPVIREVALNNLGRPYDFSFDFANFDRLCCTEFVYLCTKSLSSFLEIKPMSRRVLFVSKRVVRPDDFLGSGLRVIWCSSSTREDIRERVGRDAELDAGSVD